MNESPLHTRPESEYHPRRPPRSGPDLPAEATVPASARIARWFIAVPLVGFGLNHFLGAPDVLPLVPGFLPGGVFWVYLTGAAFIAAGVSFATERHVRLAGRLLAIMFLIFVLTVYLPRLVASPSFAAARGIGVALLQAVLVGGTGLLLAGLYTRGPAA